jgi:Zn-dependent peptidase ImmA (M78 family)/transcriptional regulator with XRE-family HTH domain
MTRPSTKGFFVKERLVEARDACALSQKDVAIRVGRSPSTISKWESGEQAPEPAALDLLAEALGVGVPYLLKEMPDYGSPSIFFRSLASTTLRARLRARGRIRWLQHISLALQEYVDFPQVNFPDFGHIDYQTLSDADLERIALELRAFWNLGEGPIPSMALVAENAGVVVGVDKAGSTKIDGQSVWLSEDSRPYMLINNDKFNAFRRQMDIAHEFIHLVIHKNVTEDQLERDFDLIEHQAKYLACALLLPYKSFSSDIYSLSLDGFLTLKPRWRVSVAAMVMRARQLEILSEGAAQRLWKARASRGWHQKEPMDDPSETPVEEPRLLRRSIELVVLAGRSKSAFLEQDVGLRAPDVELLSSLPPSYFAGEPAPVIALEPKLRVDPPSVQGGTVLPFRKP